MSVLGIDQLLGASKASDDLRKLRLHPRQKPAIGHGGKEVYGWSR